MRDGIGGGIRRRVSLEDVSARAGVSPATASRVLNGDPTVREASRVRVAAAARELGYRANHAAQTMARGYSQAAAIIVSDLREAESSEVARGAISAAARYELVGTVSSTLEDAGLALRAVRAARAQRARVVVIESSVMTRAEARGALLDECARYIDAGGRLSVVGSSEPGVSAEDDGEHRAALALAAELARRGFRRAMVLHTPDAPRPDREDALRRACSDTGIGVETVGSGTGGIAHALDMSAIPAGGVDAILCASDLAAMEAMAVLRASGRTPGVDVGVTGFGGAEYADDALPRLTTVDTFPELHGGFAVERLFDRSAREPARFAVRIGSSTPSRL